MKKRKDIVLVGLGVNPEAAGKDNKYYDFLDSIGAKFLYNEYFDTYTTEPMALLHLAAQLERNNYDVQVIDGIIQSLSKEDILNQLINIDSDVYAFTMFDTSEDDVCEIMRELKKYKPSAVMMTGGSYPTMEYQVLLNKHPEIDYITIGDGDYVYSNYLNAKSKNIPLENVKNLAFKDNNGNIIITERESVDLNNLAYTSRIFAQQVIDKGFSLGVNTTRGCAHARCSFCYLKDYQTISCQPKIRYRSAQNVVDEVKQLIDKFGIDKITFCDDDFFGTNVEGIKRACEIFNLLIENNININIYVIGRIKTVEHMINLGLLPLMKKAGVSCIYLGFDSYNDDILNRYRKGFQTTDIDMVVDELQANGIRINPGLITFEPILSIEHVNNNIELFRKLGYYDAYMFTRVLVILPQMREIYFNGEDLTIYDDSYFKDNNTKLLFEELSKYRDMILPYYRMIDRKKINDEYRQALYAKHYDFFDFVYNEIKEKNKIDTKDYLDNCEISISSIVESINKSEISNGGKKYVYKRKR